MGKTKIKIPAADIDYRYQKTVSFSQYSTFRHCPHQWYLNYVKKKYDFRPSIHMTFGTAIHETLQHYLKVMYDESAAAADRIDIEAYFKERFITNYKESLKNNESKHYSTSEEMQEFYSDGTTLLDWFKKRRGKYFNKRNEELVGIEIPLLSRADTTIENVFFRGYIDLVIYDSVNDKFIIYDIKTSTKGWSDYDKKDQTKLNQILLYKKYFSEITGVSEDRIDVQFFIVKRKIFEAAEFPIPRIQEFVPANGKAKVKQAYEDFNAFIRESFTPDGKYIDKVYEKKPSKLCDWCPFNNTEHCDKNNL